MAISEFAPPAQIVANGGVWESYAINTIPNKKPKPLKKATIKSRKILKNFIAYPSS